MIKSIVTIIALLFSLLLISQKEKFDFIELETNKVTSLKKGKYVELVKIVNDTTYRIVGELVDKNDSTVKLNVSIDEVVFKNDSVTFEKSFLYKIDKEQIINSKQFDYIHYENSAGVIGGNLMGVGIMTIFIASLASINRSKPNNFNTEKFKNIALPALGVVGISIPILAFHKNYKLKLIK